MKPWWSPSSIRTRLTGWYTVVLFFMLLVYGTASFVAVRHELFEQFDDDLHEAFEAAEAQLTRTPDGRVTWTGVRQHDPDDDAERAIDVWLPSGEAIYRSAGASGFAPPVLNISSALGRYESVVADRHPWRTLTATTAIRDVAVVLRVSRSEERLRKQLAEILLVLVFGLPLVVVLAGVGGYVLARRALAPIDQLASEAKRITAVRLHQRLSVGNEHDEIGRLAAVINDTFARLESSFDQLRRFTADASHELRTPLAVIRGIGEMGLGESRSAAEYREAMGSMLEEVDRLANVVDTLLRLSHGDAGTVRLSPERTDLGQLAQDVLSSMAILAEERNQRLCIEISDGVKVNVDRLVLREAITNVIDNAIKYSPPNSTIDIGTHVVDDRARLTVADQGPGIPPEHRARIFDRFFRLDEGRSRDSGGTGLGLAIARWAVEINGGQITVEPGPTGGSVFSITLPLDEPTSAGQHTDRHEYVGGHS